MKAKLNSITILAAFIIIIAAAGFADAALECQARSGSCLSGYTNMFQLIRNDNSHASSDNSYPIKVCCRHVSPDIPISNACYGTYDVIMRLSAPTNAHAEKNTVSTSGYSNICLGSSDPVVDNVDCNYRYGSCSSGYTCVARISGQTNAHLSDCNHGSGFEMICCKLDFESTPPTTTINPDGHAWTISDVGFTLTCDGGTSGCQATYHKIIYDGQYCDAYGYSSGSPPVYSTVTCPSGSVCEKRVCYYSVNSMGSIEGTKTSNAFRIDKEAPITSASLSGTSSNGWYRSDVLVTLLCNDGSGSGCDGTRYCVDRSNSCVPSTSGTSLTITSEGTNYARYRSTDIAGNTEPVDSTRVRIDKTAPDTSDNAPSGWQTGDVTVTLYPSDPSPGSGVSWTRYCIDTANSCNPSSGTYYSGPVTISDEGTRYFRYASGDVAGNVQVTVSRTIQIDKSAPVTDITPDGSAWTSSDVDFTLTCDGGIWECQATYHKIIDDGQSCGSSGYSSGVPPIYSTVTCPEASVCEKRVCYYSVNNMGSVEGTKTSNAFRIDKETPSAWIGPLPEWTKPVSGTDVYFDVTWNGNDGGGSGVASYETQYRIMNLASGTYVNNHCGGSDWCTWRSDASAGTGTFGPSSPVDVGGFNNRSFLFRARATDNVGSVSGFSGPPHPFTGIDSLAPSCSIDDLPEYQSADSFPLTINGIEGESGMARFICEASPPLSGWVDISEVCDEPAENVASDTITCYAGADGEYAFRCRGVDVAGNTGGWSPEASTTIDRSASPIEITAPDFEWTRETGFDVSWHCPDSDVSQYDVYYYSTAWPNPADPAGWQHWNTYGPSASSAAFGEGGTPHVELVEGRTYYINVTLTDYSGNRNSDFVGVTIDRTEPVIEIGVTDQDGNPISPGLVPLVGVELINITSNASDGMSGILNNTIEFQVSGGESDMLDCGEGPSPGCSVCSTADSSVPRADIEYNERVSVRYRVVAWDRAGNERAGPYYLIASHRLANFMSSSFYIYLGESRLVPFVVRNVQDHADDITLNLTGFPLAGFDYNCEPSGCVISGDERGMDVLNVNPYEERTYYARVMSSEPGKESLTLNASSSTDPALDDSHSITIMTTYPAYFPGIGPWAIVLLLVFAGLAYGALSGGRPAAK